jgi:PAS domain S-box-containing protein
MLFERSPIGLALCRMNGDLVDCNPAYARIVGRSVEEAKRLSYWDLTPEEYAEEEERQLEDLRANGRYGPYEKEYIHKDGHRVPVRLRGLLVNKGDEALIWSSIEDITETRTAQRALLESQSVFTLFMDHLPAAAFIKEAGGRVVYVNEHLRTLLGATSTKGMDTIEDEAIAAVDQLSRNDQTVLAERHYEIVETLKDHAGQERTFRIHNFAVPRPAGENSLVGGIAWDITDAVTASEALRRGELRYREIFETAEEGIWLIDAEANTVEVNQRMAQMLGYSAEEMQGRHVFEFMDEQAHDEAQALLERRRKGISEKYDFRFLTRDGADIWTMVSTTPMRDTQGAYSGALRMVTDITERKRAEEALRANEEQLRLILASTGEGIFGLDMNGRCTFANRACVELLGFGDEADLLGRKMHELIHHTRHDGTAYPVQECPTYHSCTQRLVTFADDEPLWRADGTAFPAEYQSFPMLRDDSVLGAVVSFSDISERKQAEAAVKKERDFAESLIQTAPVIVLVLDPQGNIIRFNHFMEKLSGYLLADVKGRSWFDNFVVRRDVPRAKEVFARAKDGIPTSGNLHAMMTRDGKERLVAWYVTTLRNTTGKLVALLAIGHDVTDQKAKEAQLFQAQKMEMVGQLTGGIAHDFNNLLTVILGNLNLLSKSVGPACDPEVFELLNDSISAAEDGAELTQRLLSFSRKDVLKHERISLPPFLQQFQRFLQRTLGTDITTRIEIDDQIDYLLCDPPQLESALLNLALNARDAMPKGGRLLLRAAVKQVDDSDPTLEPGEYLELSVIDTGEGMTPDQLDRAIEPFYTTKESTQGTGLGLSMVFGFCDQAGGRFRLASELGVGTRATIILPLDGLAAVEPSDISEPMPRTLPGEGKVLVVEDEERVRKLAARYLKELGYDVLTAENGDTAIETLRSESSIILVFSDIVMPGKTNGFALYRWVRAERPEVKVLLTSGLASAEITDLRNGDESQVPIALPKPYTREGLAAAVHALLAA